MLEHVGTKRKSNTIKTDNTTRGNKPEGERSDTKNISRQDKIIQTKQNIPKQWKKILPVCRDRMHEDLPTTGWQGNKTILDKIWLPREHSKKTEWLSNKEKEFEGLEEGTKARKTTQSNTKKDQIGKLQVMMEYGDTGLKIPLYP